SRPPPLECARALACASTSIAETHPLAGESACPTLPRKMLVLRLPTDANYAVGGFFLGRVMRFLGVTPTLPPVVLRGTRGRRAGLGVGKGGGAPPVAGGGAGDRGCGSPSSSSSCPSCSPAATGSGAGGAAGGWNSAPR